LTTIIFTALATLVVTILAGLALEYVRNARPRVIYSVKDAVPIGLEDKSVGAYVFSLKNTSKRTVKDVECHLEGSRLTKLRDGGIATPQGMKYTVEERENNLVISIPFLNSSDTLTATIIAEGKWVPPRLSAAVRSASDLKIVKTESIENDRRRGLLSQISSMSFLAAIASVAAVSLTAYGSFEDTPVDVLTFAAATADLPHLAEIYATSESLHYSSQGDLVCALATSAAQPAEIEKYRKFLSIVLQSASGMLGRSQANLYYCRGKLDLLVKDNPGAKQDFQQAIDHSGSLVNTRIAFDPTIRDFLNGNGLR